MLSKIYRMKKNSQFDYVFKHSKSLKHSKLSILYSTNLTKHSKFGIVVSKKIGKSNVRNKVKRILRECIKNYIPKLNSNFNYIIIAKSGIENLKYDEVLNIFDILLKNSEIYV